MRAAAISATFAKSKCVSVKEGYNTRVVDWAKMR